MATLALAACTDTVVDDTALAVQNQAQTPVQFGTYLTSQSTRAGITGDMTTAVLKATSGTEKGFGVFAYYTQGGDYNSSSSLPNFMYNEQVYWDGDSKWTYSPVKYWPNETAANTGVDTKTSNGATTTGGADKLTFFAYAPYVKLSESALTGNGITAINGRNTEGGTATPTTDGNQKPGDPTISYSVGGIGAGVDLCWGVVPSSTTYTTVLTENQDMTAGLPNLNLIKQEVSETVKFQFKHALTRVRFTIQAAVNQAAAGGTLDSNTKIFVNDITIAGSDAFPASGKLNLNNTSADTPLWEERTGTASITGGTLNTAIKTDGDGVLANDATPVFSETNDWYYLIPGTSGSLTITADYTVETTDTKLNGGKSSIQNVISNTIYSLDLAAGNAYTINIVLGVTSVDFTATVDDTWGSGSSTVDLPLNYVETPAP